MAPESKKHQFLSRMSPNSRFYLLFDYLPGVAFFAKNHNFEVICANKVFLARVGLKTENEIIGKNDFELFPSSLAEHYRADDQNVLHTGQAKLNIVELFINPDGLPDWYVTNKLPVRDNNGHVIGVMGTTQSFQQDKVFIQPYLQIEPAIRYIQQNFRTRVSVQEIARQVRLSPRQLDRRFHEVLKMTPQSFIMKLRIKTACEELAKSNQSISDIALSLGFYDQSSFTQQFRQQIGMPPSQYRKQIAQTKTSADL